MSRHARVLLLILLAAVSGCAATPSMSASNGIETRTTWQAQSSSRGSTTTVGLPLSRAAKIGLWSGVAVLIAYLMADDDDDDADESVAAAGT